MADISVAIDGAPLGDAAVAVCCDENFLPWAATMALTVAREHPERDFDILIASEAPLDLPPGLIALGVRNAVVDCRAAFADYPLDRRRSMATYFWIALAEGLGGRYRRMLALDADMLCLGGDLGRLMRTDMLGCPVGAVRDNRQWRTPMRRAPEFRVLGRPAAPYFNAGLALVDTEGWAEADLSARMARFAATELAPLGRDQALANCVLYGDWAELSPVWNWMSTRDSRLLTDPVGPRIVHFIGGGKPWEAGGERHAPRFRRIYRDALADHFPDHPARARIDPDAPAPPDRMAYTLFRHLRGWPAMRRYLARFPDPYRARPAGGTPSGG